MDIWPLLKLLRSFDLVKWLFEKRLILAPFFTFTSRVIYISDHLTEFPHQNSFLANQEEKKAARCVLVDGETSKKCWKFVKFLILLLDESNSLKNENSPSSDRLKSEEENENENESFL